MKAELLGSSVQSLEQQPTEGLQSTLALADEVESSLAQVAETESYLERLIAEENAAAGRCDHAAARLAPPGFPASHWSPASVPLRLPGTRPSFRSTASSRRL